MQHVACGKKTRVKGHGKYSWLNPERGWIYEYLWHEEKESTWIYLAGMRLADYHGKSVTFWPCGRDMRLHPNLEIRLDAQTQHVQRCTPRVVHNLPLVLFKQESDRHLLLDSHIPFAQCWIPVEWFCHHKKIFARHLIIVGKLLSPITETIYGWILKRSQHWVLAANSVSKSWCFGLD